MFDKHLTPNLVALALVLASFALEGAARTLVLSTGLFALSGALTNWLAVHMLFERVPGLYGSGVVALNFEEFKVGILRMVREQLLDPERIAALLARKSATAAPGNHHAGGATGAAPPGGARRWSDGRSGGERTDDGRSGNGPPPPTDGDPVEAELADRDPSGGGPGEPAIDVAPLLESIDLDKAYDQLVATVVESSFGGMLTMVGGESALQPLREPFKRRMRRLLSEAARSPRLNAAIGEQLTGAAASERFAAKLDTLLRARLDELTPEMVRDMVRQMIRRHLGWLVVWGGVFGGLIGLVAALVGLYRP